MTRCTKFKYLLLGTGNAGTVCFSVYFVPSPLAGMVDVWFQPVKRTCGASSSAGYLRRCLQVTSVGSFCLLPWSPRPVCEGFGSEFSTVRSRAFLRKAQHVVGSF